MTGYSAVINESTHLQIYIATEMLQSSISVSNMHTPHDKAYKNGNVTLHVDKMPGCFSFCDDCSAKSLLQS